jgi:hypothetical protein
MSVDLPDWYTVPGYHDVEQLFVDYFSWINPTVYVGTVIPSGWWTPDSAPAPLIRVWRLPGRADPQLREDESVVNIATLSRSRQDSWKLSGFVRDAMRAAPGVKIPRGDGTKTVVDAVSEWVGPSQIPEQFIDDKFIPITFRVSLGMRRIVPDYHKIIANLPTP